MNGGAVADDDGVKERERSSDREVRQFANGCGLACRLERWGRRGNNRGPVEDVGVSEVMEGLCGGGGGGKRRRRCIGWCWFGNVGRGGDGVMV